MRGFEQLKRLMAGEPVRPIPFLPSIKEHRAYLVHKKPSDVARSSDLLVEALLVEHEVYQFGFLMVGMDQYNVEAEALGCRVHFFDDSAEVPCIRKPLLSTVREVGGLTLPDPLHAGRMPLFLEAARIVGEKVGGEALLHGAISGPFSIASALVGTEELLVALLLDPAGAQELLLFCTDLAVSYGKAFVAAGVGVSVFDARTSPDLISPELYRRMVLPSQHTLVKGLRDCGAGRVALIVGGDTAPIASDLVATGAGWIIADYPTNQTLLLQRVSGCDVMVRLNGNAADFYSEDEDVARSAVEATAARAGVGHPCCIGTGPIPYATPPRLVRRTREIAEAR